jgi:hypothetical protein
MDDRERSILAELAEAATVEALVGMMTDEQRDGMGVGCVRLGGGLATRMSAAPDFPYFTRALGLGLLEPLTSDVLDDAVAFLADAGGSLLCVQLAPQVETPEVLDLLASRGFDRGGTWAKMIAPAGGQADARTDLTVRRIGAQDADRMAQVQVATMELPAVMAPWCARQVTADGWRAYAAFDGDDLVAFGTLSLHGPVAQLSGAGTLPSHRRRGAQSALMATRIRDAAALGATWVTAETGSESPGHPNPSLHNMRQAGMELLYHRQNWIRHD